MSATTPAIDQIKTFRPGADAWFYMVLSEAKLVFRDTAGLIVPVFLPLLIMVMNGMGTGDDGPMEEFGGMSPFEAIVVPMTLVMIITVVGLVNMPSFLAAHRKGGTLRRLATTPARPMMVLVSQVVVSFLQAIVGVALALGIAAVAFDMSAPVNVGTTALVALLTAAAMYACGMLIGAVAPTTNASTAIGLLAFFALMAAGGGFGGRDMLPDAVATVGEWTPYGAAIDALSATWIGDAPELQSIAVLAVTAIVAAVASASFFRWDKD